MEFGDSRPAGGLKARLFRAIDPEAKKQAAEQKRRDIQDTIDARQSIIKQERERRAAIREGKEKGGIGSYVGSVIREKRESARVRGLEETIHPELKTIREADRTIKGIEFRQKWRGRMDKVEDIFDSINSGLDGIAGTGGKKKGTSSNMFGISDADMRAMAGLGGGGGSGRPRRKSSSKRGLVPIYSGSRVVGYSQGRKGKRRAKKKDPFDPDIGF